MATPVAGDISGIQIPASLKAFVDDAVASGQEWFRIDIKPLPSAAAILKSAGDARKSLAMDACRLLAALQRRLGTLHSFRTGDAHMRVFYAAKALATALFRAHLDFTEAEVIELLAFARSQGTWTRVSGATFVGIAERYARDHALTAELRHGLQSLDATLKQGTATAESKKLRARVGQLLGTAQSRQVLLRNEPWADLASEEIESLSLPLQSRWLDLLALAKGAPGTSPSKKYLAAARKQVQELGPDEFKGRLSRWMDVAGTKASRERHPLGAEGTLEAPLNVENADVLKGLVWAAAALADPSLAAPIGDLAERCYKKLPWFGPRSAKVGNACVAALALMEGDEPAVQLARLKQRVKQPTGRKMTEKALGRFADRMGLSTDEVEERGVPTFDLDGAGCRRDTFGDYTAVTRIAAGDVSVEWIDPDGRARKALPAAVKSQHAQEYRQLQSIHKQLKVSLAAQVARLDKLLFQQRGWPFEQWRAMYLDHPLLSALVSRLIWQADGRSFLPGEHGLSDCDGNPVRPARTSTVTPWHPALRPADEVLAWRKRLESLAVTQPFKQAHREIYLLTDAERRTNTYSNRFAAHVLRQHQFAALCQQRGWTYRLQGAFDSHNTPTLDLPQLGLFVEYWVEVAEGELGLSDAGIYLHVITDQVRFIDRTTGEERRLEDVPPLVFSEVLRDVDLFVGVASVGNDPTWQDGGPGGRFHAYWQQYSFGELSETAQTRLSVLQTLLPRLSRIRDRCTLDDKFLVVRGDRRTYKIHLGSGNILMEPNDQYLCIVPDRSAGARKNQESVFLPFEGDVTLSIILSKAFLLAEDAKIKDPTITRQIGGA
jgi:hypothetical protein